MNDIELRDVNTEKVEDDYIGHISVNGYKHKRIHRWFCCISPNYTDYNWKKVYLSYGTLCFLVWYTEEHPSFNIVIRPAKHYYKIEFEQLFRFDFKNKGYREDRMIGLNKIK